MGTTKSAGLVQGVAYVGMLVGAAMLGWVAFLFLPAPGGRGGFSLPWYVVMPYLAAWALLSFRRVWLAAAYVVCPPITMLLISAGGFIAGLTTIFALGLPGVVFAAAATGAILYVFQELDQASLSTRWGRIHVLGALPAGIAFAALFLVVGPATSGAAIYGPSLFIALALGVHAVASWLQLRAEGRGQLLPSRAAALICTLAALGALMLGRAGVV